MSAAHVSIHLKATATMRVRSHGGVSWVALYNSDDDPSPLDIFFGDAPPETACAVAEAFNAAIAGATTPKREAAE